MPLGNCISSINGVLSLPHQYVLIDQIFQKHHMKFNFYADGSKIFSFNSSNIVQMSKLQIKTVMIPTSTNNLQLTQYSFKYPRQGNYMSEATDKHSIWVNIGLS